jgi:hypothetical protein
MDCGKYFHAKYFTDFGLYKNIVVQKYRCILPVPDAAGGVIKLVPNLSELICFRLSFFNHWIYAANRNNPYYFTGKTIVAHNPPAG